ncbi:MAG: cysteine dioxygenase [Rhodospirillales bacterium CG15_BIG_FIL_POST_REV_8_21_14_020_66_15]|nr:MAG: cysteine dioxygenase [Rhodospirillales bacterium CG15_BIG_FIL_POST_REV_8_21_14_020_66_15]
MTAPADTIAPLRDFVVAMTHLVSRTDDEDTLIAEGRKLLEILVSRDDWLPEAYTRPHPEYYQQYLLHADPLERFSVVSFVWGPGQKTPVHDHTVWGLIGMLRGAEKEVRFERDAGGKLVQAGAEAELRPGQVEAVSPTIGDIHVVANSFADKPSISIHVYGANIGAVARHVFKPDTGEVKPFVSGYSSTAVPNLWDRSAAVRATL